LLHALLMLF